jgi:transposase
MTIEEQLEILTLEITMLREKNMKLEARILELEDKLRKSSLHKNSSNSSKPPSTDIYSPKRNKSLREKSGKKSGGQPGHHGVTLQQTPTPDKIVELEADYCNNCGCDIKDVISHSYTKRQVIDIPPIIPEVTEFRNHTKHCPKCGNKQSSSYPIGVNSSIQYGSNIESYIAYIYAYQYVSYKRIQEFFRQIFNISMSQGSIDNLLKRISVKSEPVYNQIKEEIMQSPQVGSDETSCKVNGEKFWIWTWQSESNTYIVPSKSRGNQTIEEVFPLGLPNSILTSDRWAAQLRTPAKGHQLCIAHILRELKHLCELEKNVWSYHITQVIKDALHLKSKILECSSNNEEAIALEKRFDNLLLEHIPKEKYPKILTFQKSMIKHREKVFTFLYNRDTPPDNNGSERAIRNVKVKQKVSGQFKTGQDIFCRLRSVIDTCLKRGVDVMFALNNIAKFATTT